ncbi:MAG: hypothetical protein DHS20C05_25250 [Hyphococcus sp.]|nr:MAG: hypothetical protein DHS20C05_25250 [Marinicaulis sp.]
MKRSLKKSLFAATAAITAITVTGGAVAFCGFYVAKADTKLFNKASKVAIMRDNDRTVITMANDYQGDLKEFAMVIPVPVVLEEEQIHVTQNAILDHLDAYTAPRLVEYFDEDPCVQYEYERMSQSAGPVMEFDDDAVKKKDGFGVTIEAEYTVGEYDIQILSADQSDGLAGWLVQNGYKLPDGAEATLESYIKQNTKFFVAKVNLEEQAETGLKYLRPLQIAFESPKFMLPIRLGTVNADGKQELFVFTLTRSGRVETTNYRTAKLPTGMDIPLYVKGEFGDFYKSMFEQQVKKENERAVFLEYAWDMNWCDPCAADPLSHNELRELGVYWVGGNTDQSQIQPRRPMPQARDVFVTRLHVSYDAEHFPEDLMFKETGDRSNYQGRYVLRHPYKGDSQCEAADNYRAELPKRFEKEAQTLANLTGWDIDTIRDKMNKGEQSFEEPEKTNWWDRLWGNDKKEG